MNSRCSLFVPVRKPGYRSLADTQRRNADFVAPGVEYRCETITAIDPQARAVTTEKGSHGYDWLVLALGCLPVVDAIEGLPERWGTRAHCFYTPDSALKLAGALEAFEGGDLRFDIAEMPIKCPVAPLEFISIVDEYITRRSLRSRTRLTLMTPLSGAFIKAICWSRYRRTRVRN